MNARTSDISNRLRCHAVEDKRRFCSLSNSKKYSFSFFRVVVTQDYLIEVNNEHVIRGNTAILKCFIPSFVADFVQVSSWSDDQGNSYHATTGVEKTDPTAYGNLGQLSSRLYFVYEKCICLCVQFVPSHPCKKETSVLFYRYTFFRHYINA